VPFAPAKQIQPVYAQAMSIAERLRRLDDFVGQNGARWFGILRYIYRQPVLPRVIERSPGPLGFVFAWIRTSQAADSPADDDRIEADE
jgi:hypothetical protein